MHQAESLQFPEYSCWIPQPAKIGSPATFTAEKLKLMNIHLGQRLPEMNFQSLLAPRRGRAPTPERLLKWLALA